MFTLANIPHATDKWSDVTPQAPDWQFRISPVKGVVESWKTWGDLGTVWTGGLQ